MIRDQIVKDCLKSLKTLGFDEITIEVGYPAREEYGDYSSNIAMVLANKAKKNPVELAKSIVASFPKTDYLEKIEVAPPGFLNFWLKTECLGKQIESVLKQKESFGQGICLRTRKSWLNTETQILIKPFI
jgi:arginyl-tRNA synthetase